MGRAGESIFTVMGGMFGWWIVYEIRTTNNDDGLRSTNGGGIFVQCCAVQWKCCAVFPAYVGFKFTIIILCYRFTI